MSAQFKKVLILEIIVFIFALLSLSFRINDYIFLTGLLLLTIGICFFTKIDNRNQRFKIDFILLILIGVISYYIVTYFLGFFVGFIYSTYSRRILGIIKNIVVSVIFIFEIEVMRERIVKSGMYYKIILIFAVIIFSMLELEQIFSTNILTSASVMFEFSLSVVIPIVLKNIALVFLCFYSNKTITILYQLLMTIPNYILGVFPNLGDYLNSTFLTIFPLLIMFFALKVKDFKREKITNGRLIVKRKKLVMVIWGICMLFSALLIYLVSGFGSYYLMAIGSGSMTGTINKGDAVIISKKKQVYKKGQVVAFKMEGKTIVHRIVKVEKDEEGIFYRTKGDSNNAEDGWIITDENIVGPCILRIPIIGWPSVVLSELISG